VTLVEIEVPPGSSMRAACAELRVGGCRRATNAHKSAIFESRDRVRLQKSQATVGRTQFTSGGEPNWLKDPAVWRPCGWDLRSDIRNDLRRRDPVAVGAAAESGPSGHKL
jgi:hypothetical protein